MFSCKKYHNMCFPLSWETWSSLWRQTWWMAVERKENKSSKIGGVKEMLEPLQDEEGRACTHVSNWAAEIAPLMFKPGCGSVLVDVTGPTSKPKPTHAETESAFWTWPLHISSFHYTYASLSLISLCVVCLRSLSRTNSHRWAQR